MSLKRMVVIASLLPLWVWSVAYAEPVAIVGVKECSLFSSEELKKEAGTLTAGAKVTVQKSLPDKVLVRTDSGTNGWVRRFALCSAEEYERRQKTTEIPENLICIGLREGSMAMYGGTVPVRMNNFVFDEPGQGIWMDASARGKDFNGLAGDPSILFLYRKDRSVARLLILDENQVDKSPQEQGETKASAAISGVTNESVQSAQEIAHSLVAKARIGMQGLVGSPTTLMKQEVQRLLDDIEAQVQEGLNGNQGALSQREVQALLKEIQAEKQRALKLVRVSPPRQPTMQDQFIDAAMLGAQQAIEDSVQKGNLTREQADQMLGAAKHGVQQGAVESAQKGYATRERAEEVLTKGNAVMDSARILNSVKAEKEKALEQFRAIASRKRPESN